MSELFWTIQILNQFAIQIPTVIYVLTRKTKYLKLVTQKSRPNIQIVKTTKKRLPTIQILNQFDIRIPTVQQTKFNYNLKEKFTSVVAPFGEIVLVADQKLLCVVINRFVVRVHSLNKTDVDETVVDHKKKKNG